jgi:hypothetical protein
VKALAGLDASTKESNARIVASPIAAVVPEPAIATVAKRKCRRASRGTVAERRNHANSAA